MDDATRDDLTHLREAWLRDAVAQAHRGHGAGGSAAGGGGGGGLGGSAGGGARGLVYATGGNGGGGGGAATTHDFHAGYAAALARCASGLAAVLNDAAHD